MIKGFIKHYLWFWKESYSFMQGYNKLYITWGCLWKAQKFALDMVKWDRMNEEQRLMWYLNADRTISVDEYRRLGDM